jgi:hypothetical protein
VSTWRGRCIARGAMVRPLVASASLAIFVTSLVGCGEHAASMPAPPTPPAQVDPSPPLPILTRRDPEPAGAQCPNGGTAIRVGHDSDGDGVLEDGEVEHTDYVCNAAPPKTLVRKDPLAPGSKECANGGTAVRTGVDKNGNGVLDDDEVENTVYACSDSDVWEGDFTSADWSDAQKVATLGRARVVTGSLTIDPAAAVHLLRLELVAANLTVGRPVTVLDLPALRNVGGNVQIDTPAIDALALPALERVTGELRLVGNGSNGTSIAAPHLREVGGNLIFFWGCRGDMVMPSLQTIGGMLDIEGHLTSLGLDALQSIGGELRIDDQGLPALAAPKLTTIGGDLSCISQPQLQTIELPGLTQIGGKVFLDAMPAVHTLAFPALQTVTGEVTITDLAALQKLDFGPLSEVGQSVSIYNVPAMTELRAASLTKLGKSDGISDGSLLLNKTALTLVELPSLAAPPGVLHFTQNAALKTVRLAALTKAGGVSLIENPLVEEVSAPQAKQLGYLNLDSPKLTKLDFGKLTTIDDHIQMIDVALDDLSGLASLTTCTSLELSTVSQLRDLRGLTSLAHLGALWLYGNAELTSVDGLESLTQVRGSIIIEQQPKLSSLAGLGHVTFTGYLELLGNGALGDLKGLEHLAAIGNTLAIEKNTALSSLAGLSTLASVGGDVKIDGNAVDPAEVQAFLKRLGH